MRNFLTRTIGLAALAAAQALSTALGAPVYHNISAGLLKVDNMAPYDTNLAAVTVITRVNSFESVSANRADYTVRAQQGPESAYDTATGVLMTSVAQNGRNNFGTNGYPTSCWVPNASGSYRIITSLAQPGGAGNDIEYNVNVAAAWLPFNRYIGGYAFPSSGANGGTFDRLIGSAGLVLGTHLQTVANGKFIVDLRSFGIDSRTDGILLVNHAKEEGNFALSQVNQNNGTWSVFLRDNAQTSISSYEQDPVAFVFIPKTNTMVVSGRFLGNGQVHAFSGSAPEFTVTPLATGRWRLAVNGGSPASGVLIISPEGGGSVNADNIVSYQPTAANDAWEIESRDTPANTLEGLTTEPVVSFIYIPAGAPGFTVSRTNNLVVSGAGTTASFDVALHTKPSSDVRVNVSSTDPGKGLPAAPSLTFTPGTWKTPRTVVIQGQDSPTATNSVFSVVLSPTMSADPGYNGLNSADVNVIAVPQRAAAVAPLDGNQQTGVSPLLRIAVTNATPGDLQVEVFGRQTESAPAGPDFAIAVLPDTQHYTAERNGGRKEMFIAQTEWIITNRLSWNIAYVTQLGDIVSDGDDYLGFPNLTQWRNATNSMYRLENPTRTQLAHGMPYGVAVGNHEMEPLGDPAGTTIYYNRYFGVERFMGRSYYAGHYGTNNNNHFDFFTASGLDFVVIYFEYNPAPQPELLAWANEVLRTNANRRAIIVSHNMGNTQTPISVSPQWTAIYNALKTNSNVFLMLGGHVTGQGARVDSYNGNTIHTFVQDYQSWKNGGDGFMRLFQFSPSNNVVVIQTFSPYTGEWLTDEQSELYFPYQMHSTPPANQFSSLGTISSAAPGSVPTLVWPALEPDKKYEWYVRVTDVNGEVTTSPVWEFVTTTNNAPPIAVNKLVTIQGDSVTNLVLTATDPNSDPVMFEIQTYPTRGVVQGFDPASGSMTYMPARGFRGSDPLIFRATDGTATSSSATLNLMVVGLADTNYNSLPDDWELAYGVSDANADDDGDGLSNFEEWAANTNPTNAASGLWITDAQSMTNGSFGLAWPSVGGTRYRLQISSGPGLDAPFQDIQRDILSEMDTNAPGVQGTASFVDDGSFTGPTTNNARYYRIRVAQ